MKSKRITSSVIVLTLLSLCILIDALPPLHSVEIVMDANAYVVVKDESDNSNRKINEAELKGRKNDVQSKCGYEVEVHLSI
jgi:hypothetical protein